MSTIDLNNLLMTFVSEGPVKPKFPKTMLEYVDEEALDWLTNLVDID